MFKFSEKSLKNLAECHIMLQLLAHKVLEKYDIAIIKGYRGEKEQNQAYHSGNSKLQYPKSYHNKVPSNAFDFVPCKDGQKCENDFELWKNILTHMKNIAAEYDFEITCGGLDWGWDWYHVQIEDAAVQSQRIALFLLASDWYQVQNDKAEQQGRRIVKHLLGILKK